MKTKIILSVFFFIFHVSLVFSQLLNVNLGKDTTLCKGSILVLDAGMNAASPNEITWSDATTGTRYLQVTRGGQYWVRIKNTTTQETVSDTIKITEVDPPVFTFNQPIPEAGYYCKGENITIEVNETGQNWIYRWEGLNSVSPSVSIDTTGEYSLTVTDENNCQNTNSVFLEFQYPYEGDNLLLATWDPLEKRNVLIWNVTTGKRTREYVMLRGSVDREEFGRITFEAINLAIDTEWDPSLGPATYNCMVEDSCGNTSMPNPFSTHSTMHLGIERMDEPPGATKLTWTPYEGFNYDNFYIYRGTSQDKLDLIETIPFRSGELFTFTDNTTESDEYYYQIKVNTPEIIYLRGSDGKKASPGPFVHSLSNLEDNRKGVNVRHFYGGRGSLTAFPNPYSGSTQIHYSLVTGGEVTFELLNILGQRVHLLPAGFREPGEYQFNFSARESGLPSGMYYFNYIINNQIVATRKLIEK